MYNLKEKERLIAIVISLFLFCKRMNPCLYIEQAVVSPSLLELLCDYEIRVYEVGEPISDLLKGGAGHVLISSSIEVVKTHSDTVPCILVSDRVLGRSEAIVGAHHISRSMIDVMDAVAWQVTLNTAQRIWEIEKELHDRQLLANSSSICFLVVDDELNVVHDSNNTDVSAKNRKSIADYVPEESIAELTYFLRSRPSEGTRSVLTRVFSTKSGGRVVAASITIGETILGDGSIGAAVYIKEVPEQESSNLDQKQYKTLFNSLSEAIVVLDCDTGLFYDVNTAACDLFKMSKEELLQRGPAELSPAVQPNGMFSAEAAKQLIGKALEGENPVFPWMHRNSDGDEVMCQIHLVKFPSAARSLVAGFLIDKSSEEEYERKLKVRDARIQSILDNTSAGVSIKNHEGVYEYINPTFEHFVGLPAEQIIGKTASEVLSFEVANSIENQDRLVWELDKRHETTEAVEVNGEKRVFMLSKFLLDDKNGENHGLCTIATEITDKARTEKALSESLQTFAGVLEAIPSAIFIYAFDENSGLFLTNVNPAAKRLFANEDMLKMGYEFREVWPQVVCNELYPVFLRIVRIGGLHTTLPREFTTVDGARKYLTIRAFSIPGQRLGLAIEDVTEATLAEQERRNVHRDLERRVQERTAELEALNTELESFSYSVSHDLRAPIRAISGFSGMIRDDYAKVLDNDGIRLLDMVQESALKMNELVDTLLQLSRITSVDLHRQEFDLSELALNILSGLQEVDVDRDVHIRVEPGIIVNADIKLTVVLLENLLSNAWKYTEKSKVQNIVVEAKEEDGQQWVYISDSGAGFDMAHKDRLFTVFQRLHSTEDFAGDGVGLATVQRVINRHRGKIRAHSEIGNGATFAFYL